MEFLKSVAVPGSHLESPSTSESIFTPAGFAGGIEAGNAAFSQSVSCNSHDRRKAHLMAGRCDQGLVATTIPHLCPSLSVSLLMLLTITSRKTSLLRLHMLKRMDYFDVYLIHCSMSAKPGLAFSPVKRDDIVPLDLRGVWEAMECHKLGLTRSTNFTAKKLDVLLQFAKIPPAVN